MGGYFFPTQEDYDSYEGYDYSDPLGVNKLKKPEEETPNFLGSLMNWANKYEYEGTHDIDPITGEVSKKSLPGILGGVVGDLFSIPKRGVDYLTSKASGLEETRPAEEILTNALFPKYDSAPIADNLLKPFIESVPGGALVTAHDNLSKLKKNDFKPISDAADVTENALRGATRTGGSLLLDPTLWAGINAPGALGTGIGAYFGVEGVKGASEKLGESYSEAFDQGKPTEAIEPFIEALGLGYLGKTGLEHSSRELAKTLPEIKLGGGYSTRSPINLESSPAPREIPNFVSAMADGRAGSSEAPSFITDLLEPDSLIKRRDELKDLGVLVNPTGRVPKTESLYHGTGNAWGTGDYSIPQSSHFELSYGELLKIMDDIHAGKYVVGDILPDGHILESINPDGSVNTRAPMGTFPKPEGREFNPFSSRKAANNNLHGGPFYLTDAMPVAEGSYAAAGEGQGPNPEIINADVTTNKTWNLDAPVPRDIRVKGLTLLQQLINNEKADVSWTGSDGLTYGKGGAPERLNYYRKAYDRLKQARTGRDVESIMADIIDRSAGGEPIFDRFDPSGLHYTKDQTGRPTYIAKGYPLRQRPDLSPKDKFLQVLESDLGYDSVKHGSKSTGGEVTIPFSRAQIKTRGAQKIAPLSDRSLEGLVSEYETLDPNDSSTESLRDALREEISSRLANMPDPKQIEGWRKDPKQRIDFQKYLESKVARRQEWDKNSQEKFDRLSASRRKWLDDVTFARNKGEETPVWNLDEADRKWLREQDDYINSDDWSTYPKGDEKTLETLREFNPDSYDKALKIYRREHTYSPKEPELTPEDEASLKTPLYESLENPTTRISESKTPETTDIKDWIDEPKEIPLGEWVDKAARALGYQDLPVSTSNIQGESLSESAKFIQSQKRKYGKDWETKQTQSEGDYLRKLLSRELAGEKVEETPPTVIQNRESRYEEVDPEIEALRDSISEKSPYEMVGRTPPEKSSLDKSIERVVSKRPPKTPVPKEVDLEGASTKKTAFQVSLSNGKVYTVKATDDINAREQVQDLIDKHGSKFNITDVKPKYSKLESDLITSANPTETKLADKLVGETAREHIAGKKAEAKAKTAEEKLREKAQLQELRDQYKVEREKARAGDKEAALRADAIKKEYQDILKVEQQYQASQEKNSRSEQKVLEQAHIKELRDQLKVERQKAQAGDKEARAREKAIEQEIKDKLRVEGQSKDIEARRQQREFQDRVKLTDRLSKAQANEEIANQKAEEKARESAHVKELQDQLKVERQKAAAGDKEAKRRELEIEKKIKEWKRVNTADIKARDRAIEADWKDKFKVEKQFRDAEAKKKQQEFQAKINAKEPSGISQFLGSIKALASSGDLGHIARQGKQGTLYLLTHAPKEVGTAFKRMAKQTFSEKEFTSFHEKLAQDPKLLRMSKDFRLDMPGLPGHLGEEAFHGGEAIESAPVIGAYVKASDRAYTSYMNSIRYSLVKDGISRLEKSGFTMDKNPEKYRELARGINIITQRGDISGKAAQLFNTASNVFWAPRAKYSRIQQIGELVKPGESGRLARQGLAHTMAFNALLFGLLKAKYGDDVKFNTDPTNTDFLKIRIKNTTVDPWFGLGAIIRSANQGVSGEKTSGSTGKTVPVSASDAVGSFLTNSLAPGITMLYELASGKSTLGFEKSRLESLLGVAPLAMRDIRDIAEEHGLDGLLLDILSYEGEQVNTFNPKKAKAEQERLKKERGLKAVKPKSSKGTVNYKELYNF